MSLSFPLFLTFGAGIPDKILDIDGMVAAGASGLRMGIVWDAANPSFDGVTLNASYMSKIAAVIQYCNSRTLLSGVVPANGYTLADGLAVDLQCAAGATYNGQMYNPNGAGGINVPRNFALFSATVVDYFKKVGATYPNGRVWCFELGNEPNHAKWNDSASYTGGPTAAQYGGVYVKSLALWSGLARAADPTASLALGGLGGHADSASDVQPWTFYQQMYDARFSSGGYTYLGTTYNAPLGVHGLVDYANFHPYCYYDTPTEDMANSDGTSGHNGWAAMVKLLFPILASGGGHSDATDATLPILVTEFGQPNPAGSHTIQDAADSLTSACTEWDSYAQGGQIGGPLCWFCWQDKDETQLPLAQQKGRWYGIVGVGANQWTGDTVAFGPKNPLYSTFKSLATQGLPNNNPTVVSISPNHGPTAGGTTVTVSGTNFTGATAVKFGGVNATSFSVVNAGSISCVSPAGTGTVHIKVTTPAGISTATSADQYTYNNASGPTVTGLAPAFGPPAGGTTVAVTGTGFTAATAVNFGSSDPAFKLGVATGAGLITPTEVASLAGISARAFRGGTSYPSIGLVGGNLPTTGPGHTKLLALDAYIQDCNDRDIDVWLQIADGNTDQRMDHPDNWQPYADFIIKIAERYAFSNTLGTGGTALIVRVIECANEPNLKLFSDQPNPEQYARMMKRIYTGVALIGNVFQRPLIAIAGIAGTPLRSTVPWNNGVWDTAATGDGMSSPEWTFGLYARLDTGIAARGGYSAVAPTGTGAPSIKNNYDVWNTHRYTWHEVDGSHTVNFSKPSVCLANPSANDRGWIASTIGNGTVNATDGLGNTYPSLPLGSQAIREVFNDGSGPHAVTEYGIPSPKPTITPQGAWAASTAYVFADSVTDGGSTYICITAHTSSAAGAGGNEPGVGATWQDKWIQQSSIGGMSAADWVTVFTDACATYALEPTACYFFCFTDFDIPKNDNGKLWGLLQADETTAKPSITTAFTALAAGQGASFTVNSATSITATSPAGTGVVDVTVTGTGGTSPANPPFDQFTYSTPPSGGGIGICSNVFGYDATNLAAGAARIKQLWVDAGNGSDRLVRVDANWSRFQTFSPLGTAGQNDNFTNFGDLDRVVDAHETAGNKVLLVLGVDTPSPLRPSGATNGHVYPNRDAANGYRDYANFCWTIVDRYCGDSGRHGGGTVIAVELWNEPNNGFGLNPVDAVKYSNLFRTAAFAIKTGGISGRTARTPHPSTDVTVVTAGNGPVTPGTANATDAWVQTMLNNGCGPYMDAAATHPYGLMCPPTKTQTAGNHWNQRLYVIPQLRTVLDNAGFTGVEIWLTEDGCFTRRDGTPTQTGDGPDGNCNTLGSTPPDQTHEVEESTAAIRIGQLFDGPTSWFWTNKAAYKLGWLTYYQDIDTGTLWSNHAGLYDQDGTVKTEPHDAFVAALASGQTRTAPSCNISSPPDDPTHASPLSGTIIVLIPSTDTIDPATDLIVNLYRGNGATLFPASPGAVAGMNCAYSPLSGWFYQLDTTTLANGNYVLAAKATNTAGQTTTSNQPNGIRIKIDNGGGALPTVSGVTNDATGLASGVPAGGDHLHVTGTNFTGMTAVKIGGTNCTSNTVVDDGTITCVSPAKSAGTYDLRVTNATGQSATTSADTFTYIAAPTGPTITALNPSTGFIDGGDTVAISGTGFTGTTTVTFGGNSASFSVSSDTLISAVSPANAVGPVDVVVTTGVGTSGIVAADVFTYTSTPPPGLTAKIVAVTNAEGQTFETPIENFYDQAGGLPVDLTITLVISVTGGTASSVELWEGAGLPYGTNFLGNATSTLGLWFYQLDTTRLANLQLHTIRPVAVP